MIKYIILLISCSTVFGQQAFSIFDPAMQAQPVESAAPTYLVSENFEGAGTPSGWIGGGDYDYTISALEGAQSYRTVSGAVSACANFAPITNGWAYLMFRRDTSGQGYVFGFASSNGVAWRAYARVYSSGGSVQISNGSTTTISAEGVVVAGINYHVWFFYAPGNGANGTTKIYMSTTAIKPATPLLEITGGNGTLAADSILLYTALSTSIVRDKIRISTSEIGSNPP